VQVLFLLNKTNEDWWHVRKGTGKDGFVPANYVREIEGKRVPVQVRQPITVKDVRRVKRTRMVKKIFPVRRSKPAPKPPGSSKKKRKIEPDPTRSNRLGNPTKKPDETC